MALPCGFFDGAINIEKPRLLWINGGLIARCLFMIGMQVKREILMGQLSEIRQTVLHLVG